MTILGGYLAIGWIVGMLALLRSRTRPFNLLDGLGPLKSAAASLALWPLVLLEQWRFQQERRHLSEGHIRTDRVITDSNVPAEWIRRKVVSSPDEYDWEGGRYSPTENPGIQELLDHMTAGDELWWFSSSRQSWGHLAGRAGYVVIRNGKQLAHVTTLMN